MLRLGDCCEVVSGATPRTEIEKYWGGSILWATPKDISRLQSSTLYETSNKLTYEGFNSCSTKLFPAGTVLVSSRAPIGLVAIAGEEMCTNQGFKSLIPGPLVDSKYLFHCMKAFSGKLASLGNGATFKEVSKTIVENFEIPVPSLELQNRIATILDKTDNLRRSHKESIRLREQFLSALFNQKFGDPVANPKGFKTQRIDSLCEVATGATPLRDRSDYYDGIYPWIKTGEVDNPLILSAEEHISDAALDETNCKLFPKGTLLVAMYGQGKTRGKVGMLGISAATNQACAAILPSQKINPNFLYTQISLMYEHIRSMGRGGNQENLNLSMIKSLEVLVPPQALVEKFVSVSQAVRNNQSKAQLMQADTERLFMSLVNSYFDLNKFKAKFI